MFNFTFLTDITRQGQGTIKIGSSYTMRCRKSESASLVQHSQSNESQRKLHG